MKPSKAKRTTKERKRGEFVFEQVNVEAEKNMDMVINEVVPAALAMYPDAPEIIIQQDNAPGHAAAGAGEKIERAAAGIR